VAKGVEVRRGLLCGATLALALLVGASGAHAAGGALGESHVCTSGQVRCMAIVVTRGGQTLRAATPSALPTGYGPAQYHKAYGLPATTPKKITVAIVDAFDDATIAGDLQTYSTMFGLPVLPACTVTVTSGCFQKVNLGAPPGSAVAPGWDVEIALDVETVHAICENCRIDLVEAVDDSFVSLAAAENTAASMASIVSNSFGSYGTDGKAGSPFDASFNHPKKAVVAAAGDFGYGVSYPAALNTVISAGGTRLTLNASGGYGSERAWGPSSMFDAGTGSGCASALVGGSAPVPARGFQHSAAGYSHTGCGANRGDNDVSANADPVTGSAVYATSSGWIQVGGTSLSTPLIAGVYALKANATTVNYPASLLYPHLGTSAFHDVKSGNDDANMWPLACPPATTQCIAKAGYDLPTGVGTPHGIGGF
jgi:subtilase family serine protease